MKLPRFNCLAIALAVIAFAVLPRCIATGSMKQCRRACEDATRACMAGGQHRGACRRQLLRRCKVEGPQACATEASAHEPGGAPGVTGVVTDDVYVQKSRPNQNFGTSPILAVDADPLKYTFLNIRVSGVDGGQVTRARLLLTRSAAEPFAERTSGGSLHRANCDWQESSLTWNTRPAFDSTALTSAGAVKVGQVVAFDVTDVITGDGDYCFALDTTTATGVHYKSSRTKQGGPRVELLVRIPPSPISCHKPGSLCQTPTASGCTGATSLPVFNPTHYRVQVGTTITGKIIGATDLTGAETCSSGGGGVDVIVKSSNFGNTTLCGTLSGCPGPACTITYTYNAPANGCDTGVVAYKTNGNNSNNDIIDDGIKNGSACAAAGYAYVDASGGLISCPAATTTTTSTSTTTTTSRTSSSTTSSSTSTSSPA